MKVHLCEYLSFLWVQSYTESHLILVTRTGPVRTSHDLGPEGANLADYFLFQIETWGVQKNLKRTCATSLHTEMAPWATTLAESLSQKLEYLVFISCFCLNFEWYVRPNGRFRNYLIYYCVRMPYINGCGGESWCFPHYCPTQVHKTGKGTMISLADLFARYEYLWQIATRDPVLTCSLLQQVWVLRQGVLNGANLVLTLN